MAAKCQQPPHCVSCDAVPDVLKLTNLLQGPAAVLQVTGHIAIVHGRDTLNSRHTFKSRHLLQSGRQTSFTYSTDGNQAFAWSQHAGP